MEYADEVWEIVMKWDNFSKFHLGGQWVEAADSIGLNISEGFGRYFFKENKQFCFYARGSLLESKTATTKAAKRKLISQDEFSRLITSLETLHHKLNAYFE
ncbi:MAG TPA: four helix bundle protein [Chitinophagales bacterium]|nr:four helix bundle protein [Chitinophagales bacterium]